MIKLNRNLNCLSRLKHSLLISKSWKSTLELNNFLEISDEIKYAQKPVVALESTIITHGMPYPVNLDTALDVENVIRELDVIPATIGFLNGKLKVGLSRSEIETVAKGHKDAIKISRRDLSFLLANSNKDLIGGTTVSTTCIAANAANIKIFATGGIGGVHRDFNESMDVSADLLELSRIPICVVSSGVKSILDIGKTLEYLETIGVCAYSFNSSGSKEFPAFFTSKSGHYAPYNLKNEQEAARIIHTNFSTGLNMGLLVGVPIPDEHAADPNLIENAIREALIEANTLNIKGKQVTPFLLERINQITKGKSLDSNLALIKNNARTSAKIALELKKLEQNTKSPVNENKNKVNAPYKKQIAVIGGLNLDTYNKLKDEKTLRIKGVTQPSEFYQVLGGVGFNMANALIRLKQNSVFLTALGNDIAGRFIRDESTKIGFDTSKWLTVDKENVSTGSYSAIFDSSGELIIGCGDMRAHNYITPEFIQKNLDTLEQSELVVIDADIPKETIEYICNYCELNKIPIWFNPTDLRKCTKVIDTNCLSKLTYMSPNLKELLIIFDACLTREKNSNTRLDQIRSKYMNNLSLESVEFDDLKEILKYLLSYVKFIVLSRGSKDLLFASRYDLDLNGLNQFSLKENYDKVNNKNPTPVLFKFPVVSLDSNETFVNVSGAGDSCTSGIITGIVNNYTFCTSIYNGLLAAKYALTTKNNVSEQLSVISSDDLHRLVDSKINKVKKFFL